MGGHFHFAGRPNQALVLGWLLLGQLAANTIDMGKNVKKHKRHLRTDAGVTMIETLMAALILIVGSIGMLSLIISAIATNNRNKMDSTQTMLAESILEQISSTFTPNNGPGTSTLVDCAGNSWTIDTTIAGSGSSGAALNGSIIDYSQTSPPAGWHMNYVMSTPCSPTGAVQGTYDVRWHLDKIGSTQTYLVTVSAKLRNHGEGNQFFSLPVTLRVMYGS
jgi:Tfp pilus assembly protein PilV